MLQYVAVCCRALQGVAVCCSVLQCVSVCCSVLQRVARHEGKETKVVERLNLHVAPHIVVLKPVSPF